MILESKEILKGGEVSLLSRQHLVKQYIVHGITLQVPKLPRDPLAFQAMILQPLLIFHLPTGACYHPQVTRANKVGARGCPDPTAKNSCRPTLRSHPALRSVPES